MLIPAAYQRPPGGPRSRSRSAGRPGPTPGDGRPVRTFDSPRAGPTGSGSSSSGQARPLVVTPSTPGPNGSSDTRSSGRPTRSRRRGAPDRARSGSDRRAARPGRSASPGCASSPMLASRWSGRPPRPPTTVSESAPRRTAARIASSVSDSSFAAGAVSIGIPAARSRASAARSDRVEVADREVRPEAQGPGRCPHRRPRRPPGRRHRPNPATPRRGPDGPAPHQPPR